MEVDEASSNGCERNGGIKSPNCSSKTISNPINPIPTNQSNIIDAHIVSTDHIDEMTCAIDQSFPEILLAIMLAHQIRDGHIGKILKDDAAESERGVVLVDRAQCVDPAGICVFSDAWSVDEGGKEFC